MLSLLLSVALVATSQTPDVDAYGGRMLVTRGKPALWYKVSGLASGPVVVYLHGGPGYNSYDFEKSVGHKLEKKVRMVYLDQRGSGRSEPVTDVSQLGMEQLVGDVERLRQELKAPKIGIIGHAFGGLIALLYAKQHPNNVRSLVLVDTTGDMRAAVLYQLQHLAQVAPEAFPARAEALQKLNARLDLPPSARLMEAYALLGPVSAQRQLQWDSAEAQERHARLDEESALSSKNNPLVFARMQQDGYLDKARDDAMGPLWMPAVLLAGRKSHAVGTENIRAAAAAWQVPVHWFDHSGHLPYVDEPELFVSKALPILLHR